MSLYLRIGIGDGIYLLDTSRVAEIRADPGDAAELSWLGTTVRIVDLSRLFETSGGSSRCCILLTQEVGAPIAAVVDRTEGLTELRDEDWRSLPSIGPLGDLIDAVTMRSNDERPLLRLRGERIATHMLMTAAA